MNQAREMDLQDRFINTKCAKYQLKNNRPDLADNSIRLFMKVLVC